MLHLNVVSVASCQMDVEKKMEEKQREDCSRRPRKMDLSLGMVDLWWSGGEVLWFTLV